MEKEMFTRASLQRNLLDDISCLRNGNSRTIALCKTGGRLGKSAVQKQKAGWWLQGAEEKSKALTIQ